MRTVAPDDLMSHAERIRRHCAQRSSQWPAVRWPDDARQEIALILWRETEERLWPAVRAALDRLARSYGYVRARTIGGARQWISVEQWLVAPGPPAYRHAKGARKAAARALVPASRRREIAAMGGRARGGGS